MSLRRLDLVQSMKLLLVKNEIEAVYEFQWRIQRDLRARGKIKEFYLDYERHFFHIIAIFSCMHEHMFSSLTYKPNGRKMKA